jgi:hypothetical protein
MSVEIAMKIGEASELLKEICILQALTFFAIVLVATIFFVFYRPR